MPRYIDLLRWPLLVTAVSLTAAHSGWCYEDGAPPGHTGGFGEPDCSTCHSDSEKNPAEGRLEIEGWPVRLSAGERHALVVVLEHPELRSGGFQLAIRTPDGAPAGELLPVSDRTGVVSNGGQNYLQHSADGREPDDADTGGRISWKFAWAAPANTDAAVLHIAANAANDDLSALGDFVFTLEKELRADPGTLSR